MRKMIRLFYGRMTLFLSLVAVIYIPCVSYAAGQEKAKAGAVEKNASVKDEKAIARSELASTRAALAEYEKQLSDSPELADMKKSVAELETALKTKQKELSVVLEQKLDKNKTYIDLLAKKKEFDKVESDLAAKRKETENDPQIKALRKEAADLKTSADAKNKEADAALEAKYSSEQSVKDLTKRKKALESASKDVSDFKNKVLSEPAVKSLSDQVKESEKVLSEKRAELREAISQKMQFDPKHADLADKLQTLSEKAAGRQVPGPEDAKNRAAAPETGAKELDPNTEKKLAEELNALISMYEKNKTEIEKTVEKIKSIMEQLPPDSTLYKNAKNAILKTGAPKARAPGAR